MKTIIQITASIIFLCFISTNLYALESTQTINEDGQVVETFYHKSDPHLIALTAAPGGLLAPYPASVQYLSEPNIASGLAVLIKMTDSSGEVIGFASELEEFQVDAVGNLTAAVEWTFKIPGRGTIIAAQTESPAGLLSIIDDMVANGETERYLDPPVMFETTVPGKGRIVGGVGEFEGRTGTFKEFNEFHYINIAEGSIVANFVFEIVYDKKIKEKDKVQ